MRLFKNKSKEIKEFQPEQPQPEQAKETKYKKEDVPLPPSKLPELKQQVGEKPVSKPPQPSSPPLFIKVERYREIIRAIQDLRTYILNLRDALDILKDMQREIANGIEIAHKTLDDLNIIASNLDSFFVRTQSPERLEEYGRSIYEERGSEFEDSMKSIYTQLERLRAQIKAIS